MKHGTKISGKVVDMYGYKLMHIVCDKFGISTEYSPISSAIGAKYIGKDVLAVFDKDQGIVVCGLDPESENN